MIVRMSWTVVFFAVAVSLAARLSNSALHAETGGLSALRAAKAAVSSDPQKIPASNTTVQIYEMAKDFGSGERSSDFIQSQINGATGDSQPILWSALDTKHRYKLTQILTHVHNLENNFELLYTHTLPDRDQQEDTTTQYTNQINEADEKAIFASLVFSKYIEPRGKNTQAQFDAKTRAQYFFSLKSDVLKSSFNLREPKGSYELAPAKESSFNPLAILTNADSNFDEIGEYQHEIAVGQALYIVNVTPRHTDHDILTIVVDIRETESLTTTSFVLVYKKE